MSESRPPDSPIETPNVSDPVSSTERHSFGEHDSVSDTTRIYRDCDMQSAELLTICQGTVAALCRRSPDKETANEDSAAVIELGPDTAVLIVADGVGGSPAGHKASATAVDAICKSVSEAGPGEDLRPKILDGIEDACEAIIDLGVGAATTLTVVEINNGVARGYQVGDSMAMVIGQRGALKWKSLPQSPVGYAVESGLLDEIEAMEHEDRHLVSNLVGYRDMHIEIGPRQSLSSRDTVLLASDGLYDNLHLFEVVECSKNGRPEDRINALSNLASERMRNPDTDNPSKPDDLTILLYARGTKTEIVPDRPREDS